MVAHRRAEKTDEALDFVRFLLDAPIPKIALENPVGCISTRIRKPTQTIQPWQFGEDASKATCLWLKGLTPLLPTAYVEPRMVCCGNVLPEGVGKHGCPNCNGDNKALPRWSNQTNSGQNKLPPSDDRWKIRSETYLGIAQAMADQWGGEQLRSTTQKNCFQRRSHEAPVPDRKPRHDSRTLVHSGRSTSPRYRIHQGRALLAVA